MAGGLSGAVALWPEPCPAAHALDQEIAEPECRACSCVACGLVNLSLLWLSLPSLSGHSPLPFSVPTGLGAEGHEWDSQR